jgi:hypothetical protein
MEHRSRGRNRCAAVRRGMRKKSRPTPCVLVRADRRLRCRWQYQAHFYVDEGDALIICGPTSGQVAPPPTEDLFRFTSTLSLAAALLNEALNAGGVHTRSIALTTQGHVCVWQCVHTQQHLLSLEMRSTRIDHCLQFRDSHDVQGSDGLPRERRQPQQQPVLPKVDTFA